MYIYVNIYTIHNESLVSFIKIGDSMQKAIKKSR